MTDGNGQMSDRKVGKTKEMRIRTVCGLGNAISKIWRNIEQTSKLNSFKEILS